MGKQEWNSATNCAIRLLGSLTEHISKPKRCEIPSREAFVRKKKYGRHGGSRILAIGGITERRALTQIITVKKPFILKSITLLPEVFLDFSPRLKFAALDYGSLISYGAKSRKNSATRVPWCQVSSWKWYRPSWLETRKCCRAFQIWRITDIDMKENFTNVEIIPLLAIIE